MAKKQKDKKVLSDTSNSSDTTNIIKDVKKTDLKNMHIIVRDIEEPETLKKIKVFMFHVDVEDALNKFKNNSDDYTLELSNIVKDKIINEITKINE